MRDRTRAITLGVVILVTLVLVPMTPVSARQTPARTSTTCGRSHPCLAASSHAWRAPSSDSLYSGYSAVSPHWPHIRTMMTDFYYGWTPAERRWAGEHYDFAMSGNEAAWKAVNPRVGHYKYVLLQATILPKAGAKGDIQSGWYRDMVQWYARHPRLNLESAFLHRAGTSADSAHRLTPWGWDSRTWVINPADSGLIAYSIDRLQRAAEGEDGLFIDSQGSGSILANMKGSLEYPGEGKWPPQMDRFSSAYVRLLGSVKHALGSKVLMINTGPYRFSPDSAAILATGSTHMEKTNDPMSSDLAATWTWIDKLLRMGAFVDFVSTRDYDDMSGVVKRHYDDDVESAFRRLKLAELASYYMVVPELPDRLALQLGNEWTHPYSKLWLEAQEANVGHPTGPRRALEADVPAMDPVGQQVRIFQRDFDRALVLVRVSTGWGTQIYGDTTAVSVQLPMGEAWLPLQADGSLGSPMTRVDLRNADAIILIKRSTIADAAPGSRH